MTLNRCPVLEELKVNASDFDEIMKELQAFNPYPQETCEYRDVQKLMCDTLRDTIFDKKLNEGYDFYDIQDAFRRLGFDKLSDDAKKLQEEQNLPSDNHGRRVRQKCNDCDKLLNGKVAAKENQDDAFVSLGKSDSCQTSSGVKSITVVNSFPGTCLISNAVEYQNLLKVINAVCLRNKKDGTNVFCYEGLESGKEYTAMVLRNDFIPATSQPVVTQHEEKTPKEASKKISIAKVGNPPKTQECWIGNEDGFENLREAYDTLLLENCSDGTFVCDFASLEHGKTYKTVPKDKFQPAGVDNDDGEEKADDSDDEEEELDDLPELVEAPSLDTDSDEEETDLGDDEEEELDDPPPPLETPSLEESADDSDEEEEEEDDEWDELSWQLKADELAAIRRRLGYGECSATRKAELERHIRVNTSKSKGDRVNKLNGKELLGRTLRVNEVQPPPRGGVRGIGRGDGGGLGVHSRYGGYGGGRIGLYYDDGYGGYSSNRGGYGSYDSGYGRRGGYHEFY